MSSVITLLFAPSFLILIQFFKFESIVLLYLLLALLLLFFVYSMKRRAEDQVIVTIYVLLLSIAYFYTSLEVVKFIPVFTAMAFFTIFAYASIKRQEMIYRFTKKFYKKELSPQEVQFLKNGDAYWAFVILIYTVVLGSLVYYGDDLLWAFFSSIGWYLYFLAALFVQIVYGKRYAIKMSSK